MGSTRVEASLKREAEFPVCAALDDSSMLAIDGAVIEGRGENGIGLVLDGPMNDLAGSAAVRNCHPFRERAMELRIVIFPINACTHFRFRNFKPWRNHRR